MRRPVASADVGTRFGPQYIRQRCYLPHVGARLSLALRVDGTRGRDHVGGLTVYGAGDVELVLG